jgi:microsomal prostaglandin-E synthase 1
MPLPPDFKLYAICSSILTLQMLVLGGMTAGTRAKHKGYMNPEDKAVSFGDAHYVEGPDHPDVARIQRAHRNLLETLPMFFALGMIYVLSGAPSTGATACFITFTVCRILHSIVYIKAIQPWRTIFFAIASLSLVAQIVLIMITLFR